MKQLFEVPAPAKVNLFLHVTGRRSDGYHLLQSVFVLIDWADRLHFELRHDGQIARHDLTVSLPPQDLCIKAAQLLQQASQTSLGVDISIEKHVPSGAGMGGGSSDAATVLLALNQLWGLHWPRQRLLELALQLGADVPFFVGGSNAWVEGIGEQLTPIALPKLWLPILKPPVTVPTVEIFTSPLLARDTKPVIVSVFLAELQDLNNETNSQMFGRNDLQKPAQAFSQDITHGLQLMEQHFGNSRMTGSGSAVFSIAGVGKNPRCAMFDVSSLPAGWTGQMCHSLESHPLKSWADN